MTTPFPAADWPRSTPEAQGIPSDSLKKLVKALWDNGNNLHSLLVIRNGYMVCEGYVAPFHARVPHNLYSASKSFTSTLIGIAQDEGLLNIHQKVWEFFPEHGMPAGNAADMTLQHLLTMSTGHREEPSVIGNDQGDWVKAFLASEVPEKPGSLFAYNTAATYMLSAVLTRATGQNALEYGRTRLFEPLGIDPIRWPSCPMGHTVGGFGLGIIPRDLARFGYLYLREGMWKDRRILSKAWVADASRRHSSGNPEPNNWNVGYGYQFWRNDFADSYRADGFAGQFALILPHQDMVVVITQGVEDTNATLEAVRHILLPTLSKGPIPEDPAAYEMLKEELYARQHPLPQAPSPLPPIAAAIEGRTFVTDTPGGNCFDFVSLRLHFETAGEAVLELGTSQGATTLRVGMDGLWGVGPFPDWPLGVDPRMAVRGHWEGNHLVMQFLPMGEPYIDTFRIAFEGNEARIEIQGNLPNILRYPSSQSLQLTARSAPM